MATTPEFIIGGGTAGNNYSQVNPNAIEEAYQDLISGGAGLTWGTGPDGQKVLILQSGLMQNAWLGATGAGYASETVTQVNSELAALTQIANYCKANGIGVEVEAGLTTVSSAYGAGTDAIVDNWARAAARAGLPIVAVEDVSEVATTTTSASQLAQDAANEVLAVQSLIQTYAQYSTSYTLTAAHLAVGDMEGVPYLNGISPGDTSSFDTFWADYDADAAAAGLRGFSFVTADTVFQDPWIASIPSTNWLPYLSGLTETAQSFGMALTFDLQGPSNCVTGAQSVRGIEEEAAWLATEEGTGAININRVEFETWSLQSVSVDLVTSPTSNTNAAAEVGATWTLYETGSITAQGISGTSAPGQEIVTVGSAAAFMPLTIQWDSADLIAGNRLAVVLVDQTGTLTATQYGSGTVGGSGSTVLVLSGDVTNLAEELASVRLTENNAGPDTLDIEVFGAQGQLSDNQVAVLALPAGQAAGQISIDATSNAQGWTTSSAFVNSGGVMTSETLDWSTTGTLAGTIAAQPDEGAFEKMDAVYDPLAEYGVQQVGTLDGMVINAPIDINQSWTLDGQTLGAPGSAANNPSQSVTPGNTWITGNYDPAAVAMLVTVASTVNLFNPTTGQLETSTDQFVPDPQTIVTQQATAVVNPFAQQFANGGSQVIEYNTGNNPGWQADWGSQFNSVTLTYDGDGQLMEEFFQGGPSNPDFTINEIFDPNTGELWEEFQSAPPPPASSYADGVSGFVSGPVYVTEFNTGDNPNWDYLDWGTSAAANTVLQTYYFTLEDYNGFFTNNDWYGYTYEFVNGTSLDLLNLPGSITVNLNTLGYMLLDGVSEYTILSGLTAIDAGGATGTVTLTGLKAGSSTLIGGNAVSTLTGYGDDSFITGTGTTTVNTGSGGSTITMAGGSGFATISGNNNVVNIGTAGNTATLTGTGNTVVAISGISVTEAAASSILTVSGNGVTVIAAAGDTVNVAGTGDILDFLNGGTVATVGSSSSATVEGGGTISVIGGGGTVMVAGNNETVAASGQGTLILAGTGDVLAGSGGMAVIGLPGSIVASGVIIAEQPGDNLSVFGSGDTINAAAGGQLALFGTGEVVNGSDIAVTFGANAGATINGTNDQVVVNAVSNSVTLCGSGSTVTALAALVLTEAAAGAALVVEGRAVTVYAATGDSIVVGAGTTTVNTGSGGITVTMSGTSGIATINGNNNVINIGTVGNTATLTGTGNTVVATSGISVAESGADSTLAVTGSGVTVTAAAGDTVNVTGTGDIVDFLNGGTIAIAGTASTATLEGSGTISVIGSGGTVTVAGNDETIVASGTGTLVLAGTGDIVAGAGGMTVIGQSTSIAATGTTITEQPGVPLSISGPNDTITVPSGGQLTLSAAGEVVNGSGIAVTLGSNGGATINGDNVQVAANAAGNTVTLCGSGGTVTAVAGVSVTAADAGTSLVVNGNGVAVSGATGDMITATGWGDAVSLLNGGTLVLGSGANAATLTGNAVTIAATAANLALTVQGNGNTIDSAPGGSVTFNGTGDVVNASTATVTLGAGTAVSVNGMSDTVVAQSADDTVCATGANDTVALLGVSNVGTIANSDIAWADGTSGTIDATGTSDTAVLVTNNNTAVLGNSDLAYAEGTADTVIANGVNDTVALFGASNVGTIANSDIAWADGTSGTIDATGTGDTAVLVTDNNTAILGVSDLAYAEGTADTVIANGTGDTVALLGTNNVGTIASSDIAWADGTSGTIYATGSNDTVALLTGSNTATLGNSDVAYAESTADTVFANGSGDDIFVYGNEDVTWVTNNATVYQYGSNGTIYVSGVGDSVSLMGGASATIDGAASVTANGVNNAATLAVQGTEQVAVGGLLSATVSGSGTIDLVSGTLACAQPSSSAAFQIDGTATLDFINGLTGAGGIQFLHAGETLEIQAAGSVGAQISGFTAGDSLDAATVQFSTGDTLQVASSGSGDTITVGDGIHSAAFALAGSYNPGGFQIASDLHGGTVISYSG